MSSFSIEGVLRTLSVSLNKAIPFLVLIATAMFLFGVVRYVTAGGKEDQRENARRLIIYGIISLATIIAVWGLVYIVIDFIFDTTTIPTIPGSNIVDTI
jgi:uncharacterized membrane protein YidH (DUF202 family)